MITLTRRYAFPAAHVLSHPALGDAENRRIYGKCANPAGHGHTYGLEVTVRGPLDESGRVIDPARLDRIVEERVVERFGHRLLNDDALFLERVPTAENIVVAAREELAGPIAREGAVRLQRVRLIETPRNHFEQGEER